MAPKCQSSLVESYYHAPALLQLVDQHPNLAVFHHFARKTVEAVQRALYGSRCQYAIPHLEQFLLFATQFFTSASTIKMPVILTAMVLMQRVEKSRMRTVIEQTSEMTPCHLVFLASIFVAMKTVDDASYRLKHITRLTSHLITEKDLFSFEKSFLEMLDFNVNITEHQLLQHYHDFKACYPSHDPNSMQNTAFMRHESRAQPYGLSTQQMPSRSRTTSQPAFVSQPHLPYLQPETAKHHHRQLRRQQSAYNPAASAYPTPHTHSNQHPEAIHHASVRSRAPTPRYISKDLPRTSGYPTPDSDSQSMPVIPSTSRSIRRSKSQATFKSQSSSKTNVSSRIKNIFSK